MRNTLIIPAAIVFGGIMVALAVYSYFSMRAAEIKVDSGNPQATRPVDGTDHILGNPAAAVMLVEYSDIDCPFCKNFRATIESVMASYGASGNVAWAYRHLPITDQHPNAETHAEAAECVAAQGGTGAFFKFIDALNTAAPGTAQFDPTQYTSVIQKLGLDTDAFAACLKNHTYQKRVASDAANALASGATGAPYTVILIKGQAPISVAGAFPYDQMKQVVDAALQKAGVK